jgi:hypothetical protein
MQSPWRGGKLPVSMWRGLLMVDLTTATHIFFTSRLKLISTSRSHYLQRRLRNRLARSGQLLPGSVRSGSHITPIRERFSVWLYKSAASVRIGRNGIDRHVANDSRQMRFCRSKDAEQRPSAPQGEASNADFICSSIGFYLLETDD